MFGNFDAALTRQNQSASARLTLTPSAGLIQIKRASGVRRF